MFSFALFQSREKNSFKIASVKTQRKKELQSKDREEKMSIEEKKHSYAKVMGAQFLLFIQE